MPDPISISPDFLEAVQGVVSTWRFSPAALGQAVVRYPLLFVPPGTDVASVLAWEQRVASVKRPAAAEEKPEVKPRSPGEERQAKTTKPPEEKPRIPTGRYEVVRPTSILHEPRRDSPVITQLQPGMKVNVVDATGEYLAVRSTGGRPPGFIHRDDAIPLASPANKLSTPVNRYEVARPTPVLSDPRRDASVITQLQPGTKVNVVGTTGDYLEIRSTGG